MKVVILAGGHGTRISEESSIRPKPMVEIGARPIIWHIMSIYAAHGLSDFVICAGYKSYVIKEYFANYAFHAADLRVDLAENRVEVISSRAEPWRITILDTGEASMTGGRIRRAREQLDLDEPFCLTYGDCVADVDVGALVAFHRANGVLATVTAVQPPGRFGLLHVTEDDRVTAFHEKPVGDGGWINGGFFVLEPGVLEYISDDSTVWEQEPLEKLARDGQLAAYRHTGFWQPMDTLRDKILLDDHWSSGNAPWRVW